MDFNDLIIKDFDKIFYNRFQEILKLKASYNGPMKLMDFGVGEEKSMPNQLILDALKNNLYDSKYHKYADNDKTCFIDSAISYLKRNFDVEVNDKEITHIMGAKSLLAMLPFMLLNKDDYVVTLKPSYVILERSAELKGAHIAYLTLKEENDFYPDLTSISEDVWKKTKILNLNFPHNPTGATVDEKFYKEAIKYAKKYHFIIVNDAAYIGIHYQKPTAFLSVDGAKDVGIEIYTLSKSHNMTGFRIGFVAGNEKLINMIKELKNNFDSGQYIPIQLAAAVALDHDEISEELSNLYLKRMKKIAMVLFEHGLYAYIPYATFYLYVKIPIQIKGHIFHGAKEFAMYLLENFGIMTIPYDEEGHYIRFSMTYVTDDEEKFIQEFKNRLDLLFF